MKTRILAAIGAVAVAALGLTGCAGGDGGAKPSELNLWVPPFATGDPSDEQVWEDMVSGFEKDHDVKINITVIPWTSYEQKYVTGVAGNDGPDVGYMYTQMMGDYIAKNALEPLDDYLADDAATKYHFLDKGVIQGKQYAMPFVIGGLRVLYYNNDLLKQAGVDTPPSTWQEFEDATAKLKAAGITPVLQPWGDPSSSGALAETFFPALWQAGGDVFTEDGTKTSFDSPAGLKAAKFLLGLKESGAMPDSISSLTIENARNDFASGKAAFLVAPDGVYSTFKDGGFDLGIIDSLKDKTEGIYIAADSLVMLKSCPDKQLCADLIQYVTSPAQMNKYHAIAPYPPITDGTDYAIDPAFVDAYADASVLHQLPAISGATEVYNQLFIELQKMMLGQESPEDALAAAAAAGDDALAQAAP